MRLAEHTGRKNYAKIAICAPLHNLGYIFASEVCIDDRNFFVKQQYLLHMSSQYGELRPTNGWDRLAGLGDSSIFQRVSRLGFITAPTSLNRGQPNFAG